MKWKLLILFFTLCEIVNLQAQNWLWAKTATDSIGWDGGRSIAIDQSGNVYVTGYFRNRNITFGSTTLINADNTGNTTDMFLVKYDVNGNVIWAKSAGGNNGDEVNSIAIDQSGNFYITGNFVSNTIVFGSYTLTNANGSDVFLVKYDASGNVLWARAFGGFNTDVGRSVITDASGNVFLTGWFWSSIISFGSTTLSNANSTWPDMFIAKCDANGNVLWAKGVGGSNWDGGCGITTDASGNVFVTGGYNSPSITFGTNTLINTGITQDIFLVKYDGSGNVLWSKSVGGINIDFGINLVTDVFGNICLIGNFSSSAISFGSYALINKGNNDVFLAKYDSLGNVIWAKSGGSIYNDVGYGISTDLSGDIYITGSFSKGGTSSIAFDTTILTYPIGADVPMFIVGYSQNGTLICSSTLSSGGDYSVNNDNTAIATDVTGNSYITGGFSVNPFIVGADTLSLTSTRSFFLAKYTCCIKPTASITGNTTICSGQNTILNASGGINYSWTTGETNSSIQINPNTGTNYSVIVSTGSCADTAYTFINVLPAPTAMTTSNTISPITYGQSATLTANGGINYIWSNGENGNPIVITPTESTVYCVTATDTNNCSDTACVTVNFYDVCASGIYLPNAFSPNNDGENDFLQLYNENALCVTSLNFILFDRWGEKVYEATDPAFKWNGFYNGKAMNSQVLSYYLRASLIDGKDISRKGNISLVR